jgi:hypothetical protein
MLIEQCSSVAKKQRTGQPHIRRSFTQDMKEESLDDEVWVKHRVVSDRNKKAWIHTVAGKK